MSPVRQAAAVRALVEVAGLSRRYGRHQALDRVDLDIEEGTVLGLIGRNGAGKTTLIRHVLGLLKAQSGTVRVFGLDPVKQPKEILARIGYVSEERDLPGWMRIDELLRYTRAFYPQWDEELASSLCRSFALDGRQRVRELSRGQHVRTSLVLALAPRPPLLVLDEPSSGLDPVVRRDVLEAVIQSVARDGRTVLFSSHLLGEVERISDQLAMIDRGRILFKGATLEVLDSFRHVSFALPEASGDERALVRRLLEVSGVTLASLSRCDGSDRGERSALVRYEAVPLEGEAAAAAWSERGFELLDSAPATLDEVFQGLSDGGAERT